MGSITQIILSVCVIMIIFFAGSSILNDASKVKGVSYQDYPSFSKIQHYGSYYQNQTDNLRETITSTQKQDSGLLTPIELLYMTTAAAGLAATSLFGFLDVAISLLIDATTFFGIPSFLVAIAMLVLSIKVVFSVYSTLRGGGKP